MRKYTITVEAETAPEIYLGQKLLGNCTVIALQQEEKQYISAAELASYYGLSAETVRSRCVSINRGTNGKHLYQIEEAHSLLMNNSKRRGRKRIV